MCAFESKSRFWDHHRNHFGLQGSLACFNQNSKMNEKDQSMDCGKDTEKANLTDLIGLVDKHLKIHDTNLLGHERHVENHLLSIDAKVSFVKSRVDTLHQKIDCIASEVILMKESNKLIHAKLSAIESLLNGFSQA